MLWEIGNRLIRTERGTMPDHLLVLLGHVAERRRNMAHSARATQCLDEKVRLRRRVGEDAEVAGALAAFDATDLEALEAAEVASSWADRGDLGMARRLIQLADQIGLPEASVRRSIVLLEAYASVSDGILPTLASTSLFPGVRADAWRTVADRGVSRGDWMTIMRNGSSAEIDGLAIILLKTGSTVLEAALALALSGMAPFDAAGVQLLRANESANDPWFAASLLDSVQGCPNIESEAVQVLANVVSREPRAAAIVLLRSSAWIPVAVARVLVDACLTSERAWVVAAGALSEDGRGSAVRRLGEVSNDDPSAWGFLAELADSESWQSVSAAAAALLPGSPETVVRLLLDPGTPTPVLVDALDLHLSKDGVRTAMALARHGNEGIRAADRLPGPLATRLKRAVRYFGAPVADSSPA